MTYDFLTDCFKSMALDKRNTFTYTIGEKMGRDRELELYKKIDDLTEALRHNREASEVYLTLVKSVKKLELIEKENENLRAEVKRADDILCAISKLRCLHEGTGVYGNGRAPTRSRCQCCYENEMTIEKIVAEASRPLDKYHPGPV